jgi:hypothetical protein
LRDIFFGGFRVLEVSSSNMQSGENDHQPDDDLLVAGAMFESVKQEIGKVVDKSFFTMFLPDWTFHCILADMSNHFQGKIIELFRKSRKALETGGYCIHHPRIQHFGCVNMLAQLNLPTDDNIGNTTVSASTTPPSLASSSSATSSSATSSSAPNDFVQEAPDEEKVILQLFKNTFSTRAQLPDFKANNNNNNNTINNNNTNDKRLKVEQLLFRELLEMNYLDMRDPCYFSFWGSFLFFAYDDKIQWLSAVSTNFAKAIMQECQRVSASVINLFNAAGFISPTILDRHLQLAVNTPFVGALNNHIKFNLFCEDSLRTKLELIERTLLAEIPFLDKYCSLMGWCGGMFVEYADNMDTWWISGDDEDDDDDPEGLAELARVAENMKSEQDMDLLVSVDRVYATIFNRFNNPAGDKNLDLAYSVSSFKILLEGSIVNIFCLDDQSYWFSDQDQTVRLKKLVSGFDYDLCKICKPFNTRDRFVLADDRSPNHQSHTTPSPAKLARLAEPPATLPPFVFRLDFEKTTEAWYEQKLQSGIKGFESRAKKLSKEETKAVTLKRLFKMFLKNGFHAEDFFKWRSFFYINREYLTRPSCCCRLKTSSEINHQILASL